MGEHWASLFVFIVISFVQDSLRSEIIVECHVGSCCLHVVDARSDDVHTGAHNGMQKRDKRPDGDWFDWIRFRAEGDQLGSSGLDLLTLVDMFYHLHGRVMLVTLTGTTTVRAKSASHACT